MTEEMQEYDSGPFCRHWSDCDCDIECATCGHRCPQHDFSEDESDCYECDCKEWKEPETPPGTPSAP